MEQKPIPAGLRAEDCRIRSRGTEQIHLDIRDLVLRYITRQMPGTDPDTREDLAGEALLKLYRYTRTHPPENIKGLARIIARATVIDHWRTSRTLVELPGNLADGTPDSLLRLCREGESARIMAQVSRLSVPCRELIHRHFFLGECYRELAAEEGLAPSTLRYRMWHCLGKLRRLMESVQGGHEKNH